jgi:hypothetical protein
MKEITPIQVWQNGEVVEAKILNAYAVSVTLDQGASFYYGLLTESKQTVAQGNLIMDSETYDQWERDSFAWDWIASQLNLTILGDWVDPVIEAEVTEVAEEEAEAEVEEEVTEDAIEESE